MSSSVMDDRLRRVVRIWPLVVAWGATAVFMVMDARRDPFNPTLQGTARYGHNHAGALTQGLLVTLVELVVLTAILRPWSYRQAWGRALVALAVLLPWTFASACLTMHAGGVVMVHLLWLLALVLALAALAIWSGVARKRTRRTPGGGKDVQGT